MFKNIIFYIHLSSYLYTFECTKTNEVRSGNINQESKMESKNIMVTTINEVNCINNLIDKLNTN